MLERSSVVDSPKSAPDNERNAWLGITLVLTSAVAWSTMGLFVRMVPDADVWSVVFWRSMFGGLSIVALAMIMRRQFAFEWRRLATPAGAAITSLIATGTYAAIYSMQNTTIANGAVIYSTVPFMAAVLAWIWFRERPGRRTIICTFIATLGVGVTVSGTIASGGEHLKGDLAMVYCTFSMAMMTVVMRRYRDTPMFESVAVACFMAAAFACFFTSPVEVSARNVGALAICGIITLGGGLGIYTMGARRLPSAQAALLSSAEMPMSPLWVWLFFNEAPAVETFVGGAFVLGAIVWNISMELKVNSAIGISAGNGRTMTRLKVDECQSET